MPTAHDIIPNYDDLSVRDIQDELDESDLSLAAVEALIEYEEANADRVTLLRNLRDRHDSLADTDTDAEDEDESDADADADADAEAEDEDESDTEVEESDDAERAPTQHDAEQTAREAEHKTVTKTEAQPTSAPDPRPTQAQADLTPAVVQTDPDEASQTREVESETDDTAEASPDPSEIAVRVSGRNYVGGHWVEENGLQRVPYSERVDEAVKTASGVEVVEYLDADE